MKQRAWVIVLNGNQVDVVYYPADCSQEFVRQALIKQDGYPETINIKPLIKG